LRASEPIYKLMIWKELYSWFGILTKMGDQDKIKIAASFGHMNEQMSIDLIYTILHSITKFTIGTVKTVTVKDGDKPRDLSDYKLMYH